MAARAGVSSLGMVVVPLGIGDPYSCAVVGCCRELPKSDLLDRPRRLFPEEELENEQSPNQESYVQFNSDEKPLPIDPIGETKVDSDGILKDGILNNLFLRKRIWFTYLYFTR